MIHRLASPCGLMNFFHDAKRIKQGGKHVIELGVCPVRINLEA